MLFIKSGTTENFRNTDMPDLVPACIGSAEVGKPHGFCNVSVVEPSLKMLEFLAPIEIGINQVVVAIARSAGDFVEIGEVMGMNLSGTPRRIKNELTADSNGQDSDGGNQPPGKCWEARPFDTERTTKKIKEGINPNCHVLAILCQRRPTIAARIANIAGSGVLSRNAHR